MYIVDLARLWGSIVKSRAYGCLNSGLSQDGCVLGKLVWGIYAATKTPWLPSGSKPLGHFHVSWFVLTQPLKDEGKSGH